MVYLTADNLASTLETLCAEISTGLRAARDRGIIVMQSDEIDIEFTLLVTPNAFESESTNTEPEHTQKQTTIHPDTTDTTTDNQTSSSTKKDEGTNNRVTQDTNTPPTQKTQTGNDNGSIQTTDYLRVGE